MIPECLALSKRLPELAPEVAQQRVITGFDGFVDEMINVVGSRQSSAEYTPVPDIATFGAMVSAAAGKSSLREIVIHRADAGGCAVNLGDGLATLGLPLSCYATLGNPPHSAFNEFLALCHYSESWGNEPGRTLAYEFEDGKLMFSAVQQLANFTPESVRASIAGGNFRSHCAQASLIAMTNWTLYPHMTAVWRMLIEEVFSQLPNRPWFFLDLVDPGARTDADIAAMLEVLPLLQACGDVVLGLNGNEGNRIAGVLGLAGSSEEPAPLMAQAAAIQQKLAIAQVTIHLTKRAVSAESGTVVAWEGPFCPKPLKSTGAGDRFNSGYCLGLVLGLSPTERLIAATAASGFFVRNARSATFHELTTFIEEWGQTSAAV